MGKGGRKEEKEEGRERGREKQEARSRTKIDDFLPSDRRINVRMGRPTRRRKEEEDPTCDSFLGCKANMFVGVNIYDLQALENYPGWTIFCLSCS